MRYNYRKEPNFRDRCMIGKRSMEIAENHYRNCLVLSNHRHRVSCHSPTNGCLCDVNKRDWKIQRVDLHTVFSDVKILQMQGFHSLQCYKNSPSK